VAPRSRPYNAPSGRVAQWESARFTRERSQVRNPPRPSLDLAVILLGDGPKGRILYREYFWDRAEALEAVGLSEQDTLADS